MKPASHWLTATLLILLLAPIAWGFWSYRAHELLRPQQTGAPLDDLASMPVQAVAPDAERRATTLLFGSIVLGWFTLTGLALAFLRQRDRHEQALLSSLSRLQASEERYRTMLMSIGDGLIATDAEGRVELLDPVAEQLTGWPQHEAQGRPIEEIFQIIHETSRAPVEIPARKAIREGAVVAMDNHTLLIARDGSDRPITDSGAPIRSSDGQITGSVLVFRDQSAERSAQDALRESEARLSSILNAMEEVVWSVRLPDYAPIFITPSVERLYGISHERFSSDGSLWEQVIYPQDRAVSARILEQLASAGEYAEEYRIITGDGTLKWVRNRGKLIRDTAGTPLRIDGIVSDITPQRETLTALEATKELLSHTSQIARIGGWELDVPAGRLIWSEVTYAIHEVDQSFEPDIDSAINYYKPGRSREAIRRALRACMERGESYDLELEFISAGGHELWVRSVGQPTFEDGRCVKVWGVFQDITARKQTEQDLRVLAAAVQAAPVGIVVYDARQPDLPLVYANPAEEELSGYRQEELLGRNLRLLQGKDRDQEGLPPLRAALAAGEPCQVELRNYRKDGSQIIIELNLAPVRDADGTLSHFVGIQRDITRQRRLQQQLLTTQKLEAVGRLAAGVAHDYNNALQAILGNTELALASDVNGPLSRFLEEIRAAAQRSAAITRQLLGFARSPLAQPRPLDMNIVTEQLIAMLRRLIREDISLGWQPGRALWPVRLDPSQLDQIVTNLLLNARDAISAAGTITITTANVIMRAGEIDGLAPGEFVLLTVRDDGVGMDAATQAQLFEPFFTTKPVGQGTGLGMPSVASIVRQASGVVMVTSTPGVGTTVRIYLPRTTADAPAGAEPRPATPAAAHTGTTVLLCEDDGAVRDLGQRILARLGYSVLIAATPGAALSLAARHPGPIDLLITDVVMPELSGPELVRQILPLRPTLRWLFMSGHAAETLALEGGLPDAVHFIQKPFSIADLAVKVRAALDT